MRLTLLSFFHAIITTPEFFVSVYFLVFTAFPGIFLRYRQNMFLVTAGITKACPFIETLIIATLQGIFAVHLQRVKWRYDILTTDSMS